MNNQLEKFNELAIDVVEKIRLGDDLSKDIINELYKLLDEICDACEEKENVPKLLAYDLFVLHDNLEGALNYYAGEERNKISNINSRVSEYIEKIFVN